MESLITMQHILPEIPILPFWAIAALFVFARYLVTAGGIYLIFYVWMQRKLGHLKIKPEAPGRRQVFAEMRHSFYTAVIFAGMATLVHVLKEFGYTRQYAEIETYGLGYLLFSMALLVVLHDAYFYWMHRLMHHPRLFRVIHKVHHQSFNPTPMASFSFHPLEAFLEFGIVPLIVLIIPVHPLAMLFFANWSMVFNILGHLGYELFPRGFVRHRFWGWMNTSTHHNLHHQQGNYNFGLYFNFWDRMMGTNHPQYAETFDQVKSHSQNYMHPAA